MATLTPVQPTIGGTSPGYVAAAGGGDKVAPGDHNYIHVLNGGGGSIDVTIVVPGNTKYGLANPDVVVSVPNGSQGRLIGPFPADLAGGDGLVAINYSGVSSVTVAAITL